MNVTDAAYLTVHSYPGGSESLGPRIGMSPAVLRNKVNPNCSTHHLSLAEADLIMAVTGDHRILHTLAGNHGYVLELAGDVEDGTGVLSRVLDASAAKGEFAQVLKSALEDGVVTTNEYHELARSTASVHTTLVHLLNKLRSMALAGREGRAHG